MTSPRSKLSSHIQTYPKNKETLSRALMKVPAGPLWLNPTDTAFSIKVAQKVTAVCGDEALPWFHLCCGHSLYWTPRYYSLPIESLAVRNPAGKGGNGSWGPASRAFCLSPPSSAHRVSRPLPFVLSWLHGQTPDLPPASLLMICSSKV